MTELTHDDTTGLAVAKYRDGSEQQLPVIELGPTDNGVKKAHVVYLQDDFKIPEFVSVGAKEGCNAPATQWTGRVLNLKARHAVSVIAAQEWRLGVAYPRVIMMKDGMLSPALEWLQG